MITSEKASRLTNKNVTESILGFLELLYRLFLGQNFRPDSDFLSTFSSDSSYKHIHYVHVWWEDSTNQRPVFRSRDLSRPIRGQYSLLAGVIKYSISHMPGHNLVIIYSRYEHRRWGNHSPKRM